MSGENEQENAASKGPGKLMPMTLEAFAVQVGAQGVALDPVEGESEVDYVTRVLPMIGEAVAGMLLQVSEDLAAVRRQLASQRGATTKAKTKIEIMEEAKRPRRFGPIKEPLDPAELILAIDAAEEVVVAFSDGRKELAGIAPRKLTAGSLIYKRGRVMMLPDAEMLVRAPGGDAPPQSLGGIALLLDGEQAAWCDMSSPIALHGGVQINLAPSVVF